jgi:hypothetical protein
MATMLYKWLMVLALASSHSSHHPLFVSVTEIGHNTSSKALEISCKIFTDDFEMALRKKYNTKVDLLDAKFKGAMNPLVNDYIQKHLSITIDGKLASLQFLGFEQQEEGIISYCEAKNIVKVQNMEVINTILYEYNSQQMGIIHVMVNGERKSSRLNSPDSVVSFRF